MSEEELIIIPPRKLKYCNEYLKKLITECKAELVGEYDDSTLRRKSKIKFICKCGNEREKAFVDLERSGSYCKECQTKIANEKRKIIPKRKFKYCNEYLKKLITECKAELEGEYDDSTLRRKSKIKFICKCGNETEKIFRELEGERAYCKECQLNEKIRKTKEVNLERYGVEWSLQNKDVREKLKETMIERYGVDNPQKNKDIKNKTNKTNFIRYGVNNPRQNKEINEKIIKTSIDKYGFKCSLQNNEVKQKIKDVMISKYGVEHPSKSKEILEIIRKTNLERYGVEYVSQNKEVREKARKTTLQRYGVEYASQNKEVRDKVKQTNLERYGVEYTSQSKEIKDKMKQTNLERYGVEYSSQSKQIQEKIQKNSKKYKKYTTPSGKIILIQGYEHFALDELFKLFEEDQIITVRACIPTIQYTDSKDKTKFYFPDIYIPSKNKIIEVKSTWTYNCKEDSVLIKAEATKKLGYDYEIWIYDSKGNKKVI